MTFDVHMTWCVVKQRIRLLGHVLVTKDHAIKVFKGMGGGMSLVALNQERNRRDTDTDTD
jgi:hypothetical protein